MRACVVSVCINKLRPVADTVGGQVAMAPLKAHVPTLQLQKSVESKAGKRDFKNT